MDDEKVCPICFDTFKFPKLLPCMHTFCLRCLEDFLRGFTDKSNIVCPLCREPCYVPEKGFTDFPTNYFVPVAINKSRCNTCKMGNVSNVCTNCIEYFCHDVHTNQKSVVEVEEESDDERVPEIPLHLKLSLMQQNIKKDVICKQFTLIAGEFPQTENTTNTKKRIRFMFPSQSGGVYVKLENVETLFKYDKNGKIINKIYFYGPSVTATAGIETADRSILISKYETKKVLSYTPIPLSLKYQTDTFAETRNIFPLAMTELLNGNIAVCGPSHLCGISCEINDCEVEKASYGALNIYSSIGDLIVEIDRYASEYTFRTPLMIAANKTVDTIAVCEHKLNKVIIIDYNGNVRGFYKGFHSFGFPFLPGLERNIFYPIAAASTLWGNFVISDPNKEYLQVINPYGKLMTILRLDSGEDLRGISAMCVDSENYLWTGHLERGTVGVLRLEFFNNNLERL